MIELPKKAIGIFIVNSLAFLLLLYYVIFIHDSILLTIVSSYIILILFDAFFFRSFWLWKAKRHAKQSDKPMLNAGSGDYDFGDVNLDIEDRDLPGFVQGNIENMHMFEDNQFSSVYASHVLEHVDNPEKALDELERVGEKVFIVKPHFYSIIAWLFPGHKWIFLGNKKLRLRS